MAEFAAGLQSFRKFLWKMDISIIKYAKTKEKKNRKLNLNIFVLILGLMIIYFFYPEM